jgi:hypothetical protein
MMRTGGIALAICLGLAAVADAAGGITPGLAAGGVPLTADVETVGRILGRPTDELRDPTNRLIYIQRWEAQCLGARYTQKGELLALDVWFDVGEVCPEARNGYAVQGGAGGPITFASGREDVKRAFGYHPERVLHGPRFTILVYDAAGVAFYIREGGGRLGRVDAITVFPKESSTAIWVPVAWGRR